MSKISDQYYVIKKNGDINLGRFPSRYIRKLLEPSSSIQMYYQRSDSRLIKEGIPDGILFFGLHGNNKLVVDDDIFTTECICKVNVFNKKGKYVMKIKAVKGGE